VPAAVPSFVTGTSNQAGGTVSQRAAADARAILAWEKAHISASFSQQDVIIGPEPSRPTAEVIPASVTEVTITPLGRWHGHPVRVTVTSAPVVRRLAGLVNQLPLSTAGDAPCAMGADRISLTFLAATGGPPVAYAAPGACGALNLGSAAKTSPRCSRLGPSRPPS
jgi:hypothetical protein